MDQLSRITDSVFSNDITLFFVAIICVVFVFAILVRFLMALSKAQWFSRFDRVAPTLLTTLGVLGTFTGIYFGLLDFDVSNIDDSVPQLLGGLKIAFVTSICGMIAMILLRSFQAILPQPVSGESEVTPDVIHGTLEAIKEGVRNASEREQEALENLRRAVSADSDSSLLTQMQKLRTDFKDGQNELIGEFRQFAETMTENNSKALMEALEQVIRDFNTQLSEQFGENFKQLNEAVAALLTWQENYRVHVENLETRFNAAAQGIETSEQAIRKIAAHMETIPPALERMEAIVLAIGDATTDLNGHLGAVSGLKEQALQAFPIIDQNLKQLTDDLGKAVRDATTQSSEALQRQRDAVEQLQRGFDTLLNNSRETQSRFGQAVDGALQSMQASLNTAMEQHGRSIEVATTEMQKQTTEAWRRTSEALENNFKNFDQQMQQELSRSIETLGRHLASLSEKFVEDYGPLTERLREIVQIGGRV
ncbi:MAG: hypothetical protein OXC69_04545 [Candidatus Tectomicrobia bacterium]|nr:hypothetical protein [Candidatus Tectomicrobia bacterium]